MNNDRWIGEPNGASEDETHYIREELPKVVSQENSIKFKCFTPIEDNRSNERDLGIDDAAYRIFKRRRFELPQNETNASGDTVTQPLLRLLSDPFDVAQRQYQTFQWLSSGPSTEQIASRFALDRVLGAPPCLGAVNRALESYRDDEIDETLDIIEDILLDGGDIAVSTVVKVVENLLRQPVLSARVLFTMCSALKNCISTAPASLWVRLCTSLAENSEQFSSDDREEFIQLFGDVVQLVRRGGSTLGESTIAKLGLTLLNQQRDILGAVRLVEEELLLGKNDPDNNSAVISEFLSSLLRKTCEKAILELQKRADKDEGKSMPSSSLAPSQVIDFSGDVIKYAYGRGIQLRDTAFDSILQLCDYEKSYFRLCIIFTAMCVLSVPSTRSFLRFAEVLNDISDFGSSLNNILHGSKTSFLLWFFKKYGEEMWKTATKDEAQMACILRVYEVVGNIVCRENKAQPLVDLIGILQDFSGTKTVVPITAYYFCWKEQKRLGLLSPQEESESVSELEVLSDDLTAALIEVPSKAYKFLLDKKPHNRSITVVLQEIVSNPSTYCNIITTECLNALGSNESYASAFEKMMSDYKKKSGAVVVLPLDTITPKSGLSALGVKIAQRWYCSRSSWFSVLSMSTSMQLKGVTALESSLDLFQSIKNTGHKRVMFIGVSADETEQAKNAGIQPVVLLSTLLKKIIT